jgi:hypothetical protein
MFLVQSNGRIARTKPQLTVAHDAGVLATDAGSVAGDVPISETLPARQGFAVAVVLQ